METDKIINESKKYAIIAFVVGIVILITGILLDVLQINLISNNRAIVGLSFIPLGVAFSYFIKMIKIKKYPKAMKNVVINENDERLVALRNEATAKSHKILNGVMWLSYFGYTFAFPTDVFEAIGWWILLLLIFVSILSEAIILNKALKRGDS